MHASRTCRGDGGRVASKKLGWPGNLATRIMHSQMQKMIYCYDCTNGDLCSATGGRVTIVHELRAATRGGCQCLRSSRDSSVNAVLADFSRRPLRRLPHALRVSPPGLGENSARGSADALQKRTGAVGAYIFRTTDSIAAESMQPFFTVLPTRSTLACLVVFQISGYGNKLPVTKLRISSCFQADTLGCLAPQGIIEVPAGEAFTIFIVDDDAAVVRALSRLLRSHGYETRSFTSSEKFLEGHDRSRRVRGADSHMPSISSHLLPPATGRPPRSGRREPPLGQRFRATLPCVFRQA